MTTASPAAPSDEELAARAGEGDQDAFAQLYSRYFDRTYDFAGRVVRDPDRAADVVQTAFIRAYEGLGGGTRPRSFKAWLFGIAHNYAIDELRRGRRVVSSSTATEEGDWLELTVADGARFADPALAAQVAEAGALVWQAASALGPEEYALLDMHVRQELSVDELAANLGLRAGAVYTRLSRLRDAVEDALTAELLSRRGRRDCAELDALLGASQPGALTIEVRRAVKRHLDGCDACAENKRRLVSASAILAAFVPLPASAGVRESVWGEVARAQVPAAGASGRSRGRRNPPSARTLTAIGGGGAALAAAVAAVIALLGGEDTPPPPAGATGTSTLAAATASPPSTATSAATVRPVVSVVIRTVTATATAPTPAATSARTVRAIRFGTQLIPLDQLRVAGADACPGPHYHAAGPTVRTLSGAPVTDPAPGNCGFGRVDETPLVDAPAGN
jgi:RNA polymerase sigma factor (sigma-70 family)